MSLLQAVSRKPEPKTLAEMFDDLRALVRSDDYPPPMPMSYWRVEAHSGVEPLGVGLEGQASSSVRLREDGDAPRTRTSR